MSSDQLHNYATSELEYKKFLNPSIRSAITQLRIYKGSRILDAGCGPGATLLKLLQATKFTGHVTGIDISEPHLNVAEESFREQIAENKISLIKADLFDRLPFPPNSFDIVWCSDVLIPDDMGGKIFDILKEFRRILKPSGKIAIFYGNWLRLQLLTGHSELEHYISIANQLRKSSKYQWTYFLHPESGLSWLQTTGFKNCRVKAHQTMYKAPLRGHVKNYLHWHLENIYDKAIHFKSDVFAVNDSLIELWQKISDRTSSEYLLKKPGYYCKASPIMFTGKK